MIEFFQHGPGEPPGYLLELVNDWDLEYRITRLWESRRLPDLTDVTHIVFLGGQMSVHDEVDFPWLFDEKKLIRDAIKSGVPLLGICLGAQLIASAQNGRVFRCRGEKGWHVIRKTPVSKFIHSLSSYTVFQWHGECIDLPPGSNLIFEGDEVKNQMFTIGSATGVQFHPEVTSGMIKDWIATAGGPGKREIESMTPRLIGQSNLMCRSIFGSFIGMRHK